MIPSRSFNEIHERNEADLKCILEQAASAKPEGPLLGKLGNYLPGCMDEAAIEKLGTKPLAAWLEQVRRIKSLADLSRVVTALHKVGIWPLFDISAAQDFKDATRFIAFLDQGGLGLPDRDYYTKTDADSEKILQTHLAHVEAMVKPAGAKEADANQSAAAVMTVELELAKRSKTRVERRAPRASTTRSIAPASRRQ